MSDSVTWQDARAIFRLLDELKQLRHDALTWRRHLLTELSTLVGAQVGLAAEAPEGRMLDPSSHVGSVDVGWESGAERSAWMQVCERTEPELDPSDVRIASLGVGSYTLRRQELAADRGWYSSVIFNEHYRPARINHYLLSMLHVPEHRAMHYVFLFKAHSDRPFTEREQQLVHHLHGELGELWRVASQARFPRRLQQTLLLLQAGYGEKEVAERLGLSPQTVHDYCKALHKRLNVRSRAELLARARTLPQAPSLMMLEQNGAAAVRRWPAGDL
jgi:DNA-binding NarL/FixJ family response regulator